MSAASFATTPAAPPDGFGITVSYWRSEADIAAWKRNAEHAVARERGRNGWYEHFQLRVARVERTYGGPVPRGPLTGDAP